MTRAIWNVALSWEWYLGARLWMDSKVTVPSDRNPGL